MWEIDEAKLSKYYVSELTDQGARYKLKAPVPDYPEAFYASARDEAVRNYNAAKDMVVSSGNAARVARGKDTADGTTLPSQKVAEAKYINEVVSSGNSARESRGKG
ncbi:MAG: hypothetical protein M1825_005588 [Sarcosagium campestre]|nr:MAG: hypothetical protein M1825_005588 [Sarcosagium campestre]